RWHGERQRGAEPRSGQGPPRRVSSTGLAGDLPGSRLRQHGSGHVARQRRRCYGERGSREDGTGHARYRGGPHALPPHRPVHALQRRGQEGLFAMNHIIFPRELKQIGECIGFLTKRRGRNRWGRCKTNIWYEGEQWLSSRLSYHLNVASIMCNAPGGKKRTDGLVCHTCDNGWCVNPCHLYLGTASQNNFDTVARHKGYKAKLRRAWKRRRMSPDFPEYRK